MTTPSPNPDDVTTRLRERVEESRRVLSTAGFVNSNASLMDEAADLIDLLRRQLAEAERIRALMAKDWMDFCEEIGVQFDTQEAVAYELRARREPR